MRRENVHISYEQPLRPHHKKIGELVAKYAEESATLIDIGCGIGHTLLEISRMKPSLKLIAADIDEKVLAITKKRTKVNNTIKIGSLEDLSKLGLTYDVVVLSHVLEHLSRPLDMLNVAVDMLRPNGIVILAVPNPVRFEVFIGNIFQRHYVNRGHVYSWDRSHWINFLENIAGLDVIEYTQDFFPLPFIHKLGFLGPIETWLGKVFPWLAFSNIAVAKAKESLPN